MFGLNLSNNREVNCGRKEELPVESRISTDSFNFATTRAQA
jgi:hypothetical protein